MEKRESAEKAQSVSTVQLQPGAVLFDRYEIGPVVGKGGFRRSKTGSGMMTGGRSSCGMIRRTRYKGQG